MALNRGMSIALAALLVSTIAACVSRSVGAERFAARHGMQSLEISGTTLTHRAFVSTQGASRRLVVFIEGDGSPWGDGGTRVASDPTGTHLLALQLAAGTPGSVLYLGRPCYFGLAQSAHCSDELWTSARYSETVVASMSTALTRFMSERGFKEAVLVGHSGGGVLAVLMAERLSCITAVVTLAANLDVERWARDHGYLPLAGSLDPANRPPLRDSVVEVHLIAGRDRTVTRDMAERYLMRVPEADVWSFPAFDHRCCWQRDWPRIWTRIEARLSSARAP
jgi:pimeloyl-ACP methyl ester carboxylesterase